MKPSVSIAIIVLAIIGGYVALTVTGHDGTALLGALGGYLGGGSVHAALTRGNTAP